MTELATGLGMLGYASIDEALRAQPAEMVSVAPETWSLLQDAHARGGLAAEFASAWANGQAFLASADGLRRRRPLVVEWKGSHRAPGDEVAPIDLRIDHVFLVSCKYQSRIMINASPSHLFERLLGGGHGVQGTDWYCHVAPGHYQALYRAVRAELGLSSLPELVGDLDTAERRELSGLLAAGWPAAVEETRAEFVACVASETAHRWRERARSAHLREQLFWRMLRMGSAPYFVLGSAPRAALRLRVATPWDWRLAYRLRELDVLQQPGGQPRVGWKAVVEDRRSRALLDVLGHVEIRWSHGRFSGNPEAKVYLDSPHSEVPGYFRLV